MIRPRMPPLSSVAARIAWLLCGSFSAVTLRWIFWGLDTPGDYFAHGNPGVRASLVFSGIVGGCAGFFIRWKPFRATLMIVSLACATFWVTAPDSWWAKAPPRPGPR
ncbi:MAG: hypothetical protein M3O46_05555 [Myxococcota bacterium]|nr:hypothetical protein [Myxococcota bacterium]